MVRFQTFESPEEREQKRVLARRKRVQYLSIACVVVIGARLLIKDPPRYKEPDHRNAPVVYLPGMLDAMPAADRARLNPKTVAKLKEVDRQARAKLLGIEENVTVTPYTPTEPPPLIQEDVEAYKEELYRFSMKRKTIEEKQDEMRIDRSKNMLVQFKSGGYLKAENISRENKNFEIKYDSKIYVVYPSSLVKSFSDNALTWEEPIPRGYVKIKPARGITIVLDAIKAKQITTKGKQANVSQG